MLAKLTAKNQLTLPKRAIEALGQVSHFDVEVDGDRLILTPTRPGGAASVRRRLAELGLTEEDIADAVAWGRKVDAETATLPLPRPALPQSCRDRDDGVFIALALSLGCPLVSGDADIRVPAAAASPLEILSPAALQSLLG